MYSFEIENLLKLRNYLISNKEYFEILNTSPQIKGVEYKPFENNFYLWTNDNYSARFKVYKITRD